MGIADIFAGLPGVAGSRGQATTRRRIVLGQQMSRAISQVDKDVMGRQECLLHPPVEGEQQRAILARGAVIAEQRSVGAEERGLFQRKMGLGGGKVGGPPFYRKAGQVQRVAFLPSGWVAQTAHKPITPR